MESEERIKKAFETVMTATAGAMAVGDKQTTAELIIVAQTLQWVLQEQDRGPARNRIASKLEALLTDPVIHLERSLKKQTDGK